MVSSAGGGTPLEDLFVRLSVRIDDLDGKVTSAMVSAEKAVSAGERRLTARMEHAGRAATSAMSEGVKGLGFTFADVLRDLLPFGNQLTRTASAGIEVGRRMGEAGESTGLFGSALIGVAGIAAAVVVALGMLAKATIGIAIAEESSIARLRINTGLGEGATAKLAGDLKALADGTTHTATELNLAFASVAGRFATLHGGAVDAVAVLDLTTNAMHLASAQGIPLASAMSAIVDVMERFKEPGLTVESITNTLNATAKATNIGVGELGAAFARMSANAGSAKPSLADLSAGFIAVSEASGLNGRQAIQAWSGALSSLSTPTTEAKEIFRLYGIQLTDVNGKFVGLRSVVEQFSRTFGDYTAQSQDDIAQTLLGTTALNDVIYGGVEAWDQYANAAASANTALKDAGIAAKTTQEKIDEGSTRLQALGSWMGSTFLDVIGLVAEQISNLGTAFNSLGMLAQIAIQTVGGAINSFFPSAARVAELKAGMDLIDQLNNANPLADAEKEAAILEKRYADIASTAIPTPTPSSVGGRTTGSNVFVHPTSSGGKSAKDLAAEARKAYLELIDTIGRGLAAAAEYGFTKIEQGAATAENAATRAVNAISASLSLFKANKIPEAFDLLSTGTDVLREKFASLTGEQAQTGQVVLDTIASFVVQAQALGDDSEALDKLMSSMSLVINKAQELGAGIDQSARDLATKIKKQWEDIAAAEKKALEDMQQMVEEQAKRISQTWLDTFKAGVNMGTRDNGNQFVISDDRWTKERQEAWEISSFGGTLDGMKAKAQEAQQIADNISAWRNKAIVESNAAIDAAFMHAQLYGTPGSIFNVGTTIANQMHDVLGYAGPALDAVLLRAKNTFGGMFGSVLGGLSMNSAGMQTAQQLYDALYRIPSFDNGGMVNGPAGVPRLAVVHGGERVSTAGSTDMTNGLLSRIAGAIEAGQMIVMDKQVVGKVINNEIMDTSTTRARLGAMSY